MTDAQGFWSYVHADDEAESGRISRLAHDVVAQFEMLTGEPLTLFLDRDALKWGDEWRDRINTSLASVAFFIPVLTPRYFMSAECRRELQFFARKATSLGVKDLILPLLYVSVPALEEDEPSDDLMKLTRSFQWEDWRELRFADPASADYRNNVARLAERLVTANRQAERNATPVLPSTTETLGSETEDDDTPGLIDRLALAEEALPRMTTVLTDITAEMQRIGQLATEAGEEITRADKQAPGFTVRILVARKLANRLNEPVDRIVVLVNEFASHLHSIDEGFKVAIEIGAEEAKKDADSRNQICSFFSVVRTMNDTSHQAVGQVQFFVDTLAPMDRMSRDLRPPLRRLRTALTQMVEASEVMAEWVRLIDATDIDCGEIGTVAARIVS